MGASGEKRATKRENGTGGGERRADGARRNTKTARAGRKRRADGARRNGITLRRRMERPAGSARRDGKPGYHGRETVNHKRGGGKINASRPQQQTQPNKLAVTPE